MATSSDKSKFGARGPAVGRTPDFLLDPLPVPDVVESDTDTAWGRWEDSLKAEDPQPDFGDTVPSASAPMGLDHTPKQR
jgi:hypothetical protein